MRLPTQLAGAVDRYDDELREAENFGLASEEWWQESCVERHRAAARAWAEYYGMTYEEAYRQFAAAVALYHEHGQFERVGVTETGYVRGMRELWSGMSDGDHTTGAEPVEVPEWVQTTEGVVYGGTAHLVYAYVMEEE